VNRFVFSLEKILRFKQHGLRLAEIRQQQAARLVRNAQAEVETIQYKLDQTCVHLQEKLGTAQDATMWVSVYAQAVRLEAALQTARQTVQRAERELQQGEAARKQATLEVETLLTLRQNRWHEYCGECQKAVQEELDELGVRRWRAARVEDADEGDSKGTQP
jgi:flagellar export protein FliJ